MVVSVNLTTPRAVVLPEEIRYAITAWLSS